MCYTVVVLTELCQYHHPLRGAVAWRVCKTHAHLCFLGGSEWNTLCDKTDENAFVLIEDWQPEYNYEGPCRTCQNIQRVVKDSDLARDSKAADADVLELKKEIKMLREESEELPYDGDRFKKNQARLEKAIDELKRVEPDATRLDQTMDIAFDSILAEGDKFIKDVLVDAWKESKERTENVFYYGNSGLHFEADARAAQEDRPELFPFFNPEIVHYSLVSESQKVWRTAADVPVPPKCKGPGVSVHW